MPLRCQITFCARDSATDSASGWGICTHHLRELRMSQNIHPDWSIHLVETYTSRSRAKRSSWRQPGVSKRWRHEDDVRNDPWSLPNVTISIHRRWHWNILQTDWDHPKNQRKLCWICLCRLWGCSSVLWSIEPRCCQHSSRSHLVALIAGILKCPHYYSHYLHLLTTYQWCTRMAIQIIQNHSIHLGQPWWTPSDGTFQLAGRPMCEITIQGLQPLPHWGRHLGLGMDVDFQLAGVSNFYHLQIITAE